LIVEIQFQGRRSCLALLRPVEGNDKLHVVIDIGILTVMMHAIEHILEKVGDQW